MHKPPLSSKNRNQAQTHRNLKIPRERIILRAGMISIITNFLLAGFKTIVGILSNSLAIISDAIHGLIDAISGVVVIIGEKLASHERYAKKRRKIERATTIIIATIIIVVGIHIFIESIEKISHPEPVDYSLSTMIILIASVFVKLFLGLYLKAKGRQVNADAVIAAGTEAMNDFLISIAVLASAIIYLIWNIDIEAYISILISILIIKFGLEFIFPQFFHHKHVHHKIS